MTTTAPLTDARDRLSEIIDNVLAEDEDYVITKHGRPVAVVVNFDSYEAMRETLNIVADPEAMASLTEAEADLAEGEIEPL